MNIERHLNKRIRYLTVDASIHFDAIDAFYGQPQVHLIAFRNAYESWWKDCQIGVKIHDMDDYDIGYIYTAENEEQFFNVLYELINWMNNLEHGLCIYDEFISDIDGFFPECGCKKEKWQMDSMKSKSKRNS